MIVLSISDKVIFIKYFFVLCPLLRVGLWHELALDVFIILIVKQSKNVRNVAV